ncbi:MULTISPECIES: VOC family protein [unclassified Synechocystis]|nr:MULTISPECIES: VOC family protein [unclassified Synechocystis]
MGHSAMVFCKKAFLTIGAVNFAEVVAFYQSLLEQEPQPYSPGRYGEFQLPGMVLAIFSPHPDHAQEFSCSDRSGFSLCLEVADLPTAIASIGKFHLPIAENNITYASHGREIYLYDPAGNRLILHENC